MPVVDGASIKTFEALPTGEYPSHLESFKNTKTKDGESDNIELTFTVDEPEEYRGRKFFYILNLKPQSLWNLKRTFIALGADPEIFADSFDTDEILPDLIGQECRVAASIQEEGQYAGRQRVDEIKPVSVYA